VSILASNWNVSHKASNASDIACRILVADLGRWDFLQGHKSPE
jgi:hypothetical protein